MATKAPSTKKGGRRKKPPADGLPVPREALLELGLTDEQIQEAIDSAPAVCTGAPEVDGCYFDVDAVAKVIKALRALRHTKTKRWFNKPLDPDPWQVVWILAPVFGWKNPDGTRVARVVWVEVPRKNGKSTIASGIALVLLCADGEPGAEVYAAAADRNQARIVFGDAKKMAESSPTLRGRVKPLATVITYPRTGAVFRALSKIAEVAHGLNVHGAVIDEVHVLKRQAALVEAIETGTGARDQPLIVFITTADDGDEHTPYGERHDYTEKLAAKIHRDPTHYGVIWRADVKDDPFDERTWAKANPGLNKSKRIEYMRSEASKARSQPTRLPTFLRLELNVRHKATSGFLPLAGWDRGAQLVIEEQLKGRTCYGGLDLSATTDLTALVLAFPTVNADPQEPGGLVVDVVCRFWLPEDRLPALEEHCQVPFAQWRAEGFLKTTEGNVVDYREIRKEIRHLRDDLGFDIADIGYDPWNATETINELTDDGFVMVPVRQGYASLSPPTKFLERLVLTTGSEDDPVVGLRHGGHPVLRWNADCAEVKRDENGNIKLVKPDSAKSSKRIDGMAALVNSMDGVMRRGLAPKRRSAYEDHGLEVV